MNTFNLSLVFGEAEHVVTFVCASPLPLNPLDLNAAATESFKIAWDNCHSIKEVIEQTANGIREMCQCQVVTVIADAACMIPRA